MSSSQPLRDRIHREADLQDVEIEAIRTIDTESEGTTLRILHADAEDEADQVGFQITKPPGPHADQMFSDRLEDGMRQMSDLVNGTGGESSTSTQSSEPSETSDTSEPSERTQMADSGATESAHETLENEILESVELTVELDEDSLESVRSEVADVLEEYDARSVDTARVDELEARIERIEQAFEALGQFGGSE